MSSCLQYAEGLHYLHIPEYNICSLFFSSFRFPLFFPLLYWLTLHIYLGHFTTVNFIINSHTNNRTGDVGGGGTSAVEDWQMLTCTTRTRLSGYFSKTAEKASTGRRSTVEFSATRADTVRYGLWCPCLEEIQEIWIVYRNHYFLQIVTGKDALKMIHSQNHIINSYHITQNTFLDKQKIHSSQKPNS